MPPSKKTFSLASLTMQVLTDTYQRSNIASNGITSCRSTAFCFLSMASELIDISAFFMECLWPQSCIIESWRSVPYCRIWRSCLRVTRPRLARKALTCQVSVRTTYFLLAHVSKIPFDLSDDDYKGG